MLTVRDGNMVTQRLVSADDLALTLLRETSLSSGVLPETALWWGQARDGVEVALWRPPQVWPVAIQLEAFQPPERLRIPMPGLVFVCRPARPPRVYAAKRRPEGPEDMLFRAPLFNVDAEGRSCQGTHAYPQDLSRVPESFFLSYFAPHVGYGKLSHRYGNNLLQMWRDIDGRKRYPIGDLVKSGKVKEIMDRR